MQNKTELPDDDILPSGASRRLIENELRQMLRDQKRRDSETVSGKSEEVGGSVVGSIIDRMISAACHVDLSSDGIGSDGDCGGGDGGGGGGD